MIRSYHDFLERRWNELGMPARMRTAPDTEDAQRPIQVAWLIQAVGELRHTTLHEGRTHPDVGLLFKDTGNHFDAGNGLKVATDIICVCDTNAAGDVTDPHVFAIVDGIVSVNRYAAHPGWIVNGMVSAADVARFRVPPAPGTGQGQPEENVTPEPAPPPSSTDALLVQITGLLQELRATQDADRAMQQRIAEGIEGLRQDVATAGKLLGVLAAGGGLGNIGGPGTPR